jgi:hypothetical protein
MFTGFLSHISHRFRSRTFVYTHLNIIRVLLPSLTVHDEWQTELLSCPVRGRQLFSFPFSVFVFYLRGRDSNSHFQFRTWIGSLAFFFLRGIRFHCHQIYKDENYHCIINMFWHPNNDWNLTNKFCIPFYPVLYWLYLDLQPCI